MFQIVLHKSGYDPDFRATKRFQIDVEPLIENLVKNSSMSGMSEDESKRMKKELEDALTAKQESEARLAQVWSLSSFKVSRQLLANDLNQVSFISLLMTSSTALANKGLFELTQRPSSGCYLRKLLKNQVVSGGKAKILPKFGQILAFSPEYNLVSS